jgi:amino acid adenylation domain-containing protein
VDQIVARHESLRTTFEPRDGIPSQIIHERAAVEVPMIDLSDHGDPAADAIGSLETESLRPFDLVRGPLLRVLILKLGDDNHILLLCIHHIVSDGWSMSILCDELEKWYSAFAAGVPADLRELPIQYADFAVWQRSRLEGEQFARQLAYWKKQLAGPSENLEFPSARRRSGLRSPQGGKESFSIPHPLRDSLQKLSQAENASLFMTLLAGFAALLHRYTGLDRLSIGIPAANRDSLQLENLIGFFTNTIVLQTGLDGAMPFRTMLSRVRQKALESYSNPDVPFERLVEELQPERNLGLSPLVQVIFAQTPEFEIRLPGLESLPVDLPCRDSKFDLEVALFEKPGSLRGEFIYSADLFDSAAIRRMTGHYLTLLAGIAADPDVPVGRLPLLTPEERHMMLEDWNDTAADFPGNATISELFDAQAARRPHDVAVRFEDRDITYRDLQRSSEGLATLLLEEGLAAESPVGVLSDGAIDAAAAFLAVLKAGGCYLPLDPALPAARLAWMIEDSGVSAVLASDSLKGILPSKCHVLPIGGVQPACPEERQPLLRRGSSDSLAYIMYTSGSTGQPKGVAVPHRAVIRLVMSTNYVSLAPGDTIAQLSNPAFDASTFEIWGALLNGCRLAGVRRETLLDPSRFFSFLESEKVDTLFLTAALFNQMVRENPAGFRGVRDLIVGGEALDARYLAAVLKHGPPTRLLNGYGPTESTTFAAWHLIEEIPAGASTVPIGRPLSNTRLYVLDPWMAPVPIGVPGELCIAGEGLARGYFRRPELTAASFVTDPFSDDPSRRIYKTGDVARYLPDGSLEYLGRKDRQVKLRGYRIELLEVASALELHPAVSQAFVLMDRGPEEEKRLVAFIVPAGNPAPAIGELRAFLKDRLSDYMIPSAYVTLEKIPLDSNRKVDYEALTRLVKPQVETGKEFLSPRDNTEQRLVRIWEKLLHVHPVGIRDNFFDLGGHSLLAVRLMSQIEKEFSRRPPLALIFQAPTIERFAAALKAGRESMQPAHLVPAQPLGTRPPLFCCHAEIGDLARHLGFDQPCYGFEPHGFDGNRAPGSVEEMAAGNVSELLSQGFRGPFYLAGGSFGGTVAFEMAHQLIRRGEKVAFLALIDPTPLPNTVRESEDGAVRGTAASHFREILRLGLKDRISYVARRAQWHVGRRLQMWVCQAWLTAGKRVPSSLRGFYWYEVGLRISSRYKPGVFPGRIVIFRTEENDVSSWSALAAGGAEVCGLSGRHNRIFFEPGVAALAERLASCLRAAQSRC